MSDVYNRLIVGTLTGIVKGYEEKEKQKGVAWLSGKAKSGNVVEHLAWRDAQESEVMVSCKNGSIMSLDASTGQITASLKLPSSVIGMCGVESGDKLLSCSSSGVVEVRKWPPMVKSHGVKDSIVNSFQIDEGLSRFIPSPTSSNLCLLLGKEGKLSQILDVNKEKSVWKARNVRNDFLDMMVPIYDAAASWLSEREFVVVTRAKHVRVYDYRAQRRPVYSVEYGEDPFSAIAIDPHGSGKLVSVADVKGNISLLDIRKGGRKGSGGDMAKESVYVIGSIRFHGSVGSIRSLTYHPYERKLAAVGLDRFLHVWDTENRKSLVKLYMKQRLSQVLFSSLSEIKNTKEGLQIIGDVIIGSGDGGGDDEENDEWSNDDLWEHMGVVKSDESDEEEEEEEEDKEEMYVKETTHSVRNKRGKHGNNYKYSRNHEEKIKKKSTIHHGDGNNEERKRKKKSKPTENNALRSSFHGRGKRNDSKKGGGGDINHIDERKRKRRRNK